MTTTDAPHTHGTEPRRDGRRRGRRSVAVVMGVVVLVAGAIAGTFVLRGGDDAAPRASAPPKVPTGAIRADIDGDGRADVVQLTKADLVRVSLASGRTVTQLLQDQPRLEGVADVGGLGLAVLISHRDEGGRDWTAWTVHGAQLVELPTRQRAVIGSDPGSSVAWIAGGRLYDGSLDELQTNADQVAVSARTWTWGDGRLTSSRSGVWCWDRASGRPPSTCAAGQDWTYDAGPHGDLPALLPTVHPSWPSVDHASFGEQSWSLRKVGRGDPESSTYDLTRTADGNSQTLRVPRGWSPSLFPSPVRLGDADGLLLSQEGGDSDTWRVYADLGGRVQQVGQQGPVRLGGGFTRDGDRAYLSWLTPDGSLYTRIGTGPPGHFHVYAWQLTGGDTTTPPTLVAHDLGTVCIDDMWQTYGTCR